MHPHRMHHHRRRHGHRFPRGGFPGYVAMSPYYDYGPSYMVVDPRAESIAQRAAKAQVDEAVAEAVAAKEPGISTPMLVGGALLVGGLLAFIFGR